METMEPNKEFQSRSIVYNLQYTDLDTRQSSVVYKEKTSYRCHFSIHLPLDLLLLELFTYWHPAV